MLDGIQERLQKSLKTQLDARQLTLSVAYTGFYTARLHDSAHVVTHVSSYKDVIPDAEEDLRTKLRAKLTELSSGVSSPPAPRPVPIPAPKPKPPAPTPAAAKPTPVKTAPLKKEKFRTGTTEADTIGSLTKKLKELCDKFNSDVGESNVKRSLEKFLGSLTKTPEHIAEGYKDLKYRLSKQANNPMRDEITHVLEHLIERLEKLVTSRAPQDFPADKLEALAAAVKEHQQSAAAAK